MIEKQTLPEISHTSGFKIDNEWLHINCCFVPDAQADVRFKYDLLEVGPLNMIGFDVVNKVRAAVRSISEVYRLAIFLLIVRRSMFYG